MRKEAEEAGEGFFCQVSEDISVMRMIRTFCREDDEFMGD